MSLTLKYESQLKPYTQAPTWRWFSGLTCVLFAFALFLVSLVFLELPNLLHGLIPLDWPLLAGAPLPVRISYSLQLWAYAFLFCTLGVRLATLVYLLLLLSALVLPVFAEGGGLAFWWSPAVAYVLGALFAFIVMAQKWQFLLKSHYISVPVRQAKNHDSLPSKHAPWKLRLKGALLALWTLFTLHFFGSVGLALLVLFQQLTLFEATQWFLTHTVFPLPYDYVGLLLILWGTRTWRMLLRFFLYSPERAKPPALELSEDVA